MVQVLDEHCKVVEELRLSDTYLNLTMIQDKYYGILRGMMKQEQQMYIAGYTPEVLSDRMLPIWIMFFSPWFLCKFSSKFFT